MKNEKLVSSLILSTVAAIVGVGVMPSADAKDTGGYCQNATCKGHSECHGHGNDCFGQKDCSGHGTLKKDNAADCKEAGGPWGKDGDTKADAKGKKALEHAEKDAKHAHEPVKKGQPHH